MTKGNYIRLDAFCGCGSPVKLWSGRGRKTTRCEECSTPKPTGRRSAKVSKPCEYCGVLMAPALPSRAKKFCSIQCVGKSQRKHPEWKCAECGVMFFRRPGGDESRSGRSPSYCSKECYVSGLSERLRGRGDTFSPEAIARRKERARARQESLVIERQRRAKEREARKKKREQENMARFVEARSRRDCDACGGLLGLTPYTNRVCSKRCLDDMRRRSRRRSKAAYRARLRDATVERFLDIEIFRRDGWRCMLCGKNTPERLMGTNHRDAPTLDHIVALANGGEHSRVNTQCACRICNSIKSDGPPRGQMRLF